MQDRKNNQGIFFFINANDNFLSKAEENNQNEKEASQNETINARQNKTKNSTHWIILDTKEDLLSKSEICWASSKMNPPLPFLALRQSPQKKSENIDFYLLFDNNKKK